MSRQRLEGAAGGERGTIGVASSAQAPVTRATKTSLTSTLRRNRDTRTEDLPHQLARVRWPLASRRRSWLQRRHPVTTL